MIKRYLNKELLLKISKMKKFISFLILGILLVSIAGVIAVAQGNNSGNASNGQGNQSGNVSQGNKTGGTTVTVNKTRVDKESITFLPWQKRNESECLEGCSCHGAVMSCETETGKVMTIQAGRSGNIIVITIDGTEVETELEVETEANGNNKTKLKTKLSDGSQDEIKIMPDTASERALERLRLKACSEENSCTIELKEVSNKATYEIQAERHFRILAMFQVKAQEKAQVDAETGEVTVVKKPWWAFLATEPQE